MSDIQSEDGDRNEAAQRKTPVTPEMVGLNTHQMIFEMQGTLSSLVTEVRRLIKDRDEDRQTFRSDMAEIKTNLRLDIGELKTDLKDFKKDEFKPLRDEVAGLKLQWAKVAGVAAAVGTLLTIGWEFLKAKIGG